ncbi:hypothetical protein H0E87_002008 [Populus deltoides]|uniref:Uncharacterized protein n=1 Tax=Populus deltoides TaxID=3696 RepID=A0A8T2ZU09_POPDE|nr:hypothetical protein H0E87_002008 [Populus deltoides]
MVMVAEKVRQRLLPGSSSQSSCGDDEEMDSKEETKDWLMSVGIISPVTKESAEFVRFPQKKAGGMINLVWTPQPCSHSSHLRIGSKHFLFGERLDVYASLSLVHGV